MAARACSDQLGQVLKNWTLFTDALVSAGLEIQQMTLDQRGAWSVVLNNGTSLHLGRDAVWERLQRLMSSWICVAAGTRSCRRHVMST